MSVRDGYYAGWRGLEYEASPDEAEVRLYAGAPAAGFAEVFPGRYVRVVPAAEIEHLDYVITMGTWREQPFQILGEHGDWLRVEYAGSNTVPAERLDLECFDIGVHQAWAPRAEVTDVHEERL